MTFITKLKVFAKRKIFQLRGKYFYYLPACLKIIMKLPNINKLPWQIKRREIDSSFSTCIHTRSLVKRINIP